MGVTVPACLGMTGSSRTGLRETLLYGISARCIEFYQCNLSIEATKRVVSRGGARCARPVQHDADPRPPAASRSGRRPYRATYRRGGLVRRCFGRGRASGASDYQVALGKPLHANVTGDAAYVVASATMTFRLGGRPVTQPGAVFTVALRKFPAGWLITSWAWAKGSSSTAN